MPMPPFPPPFVTALGWPQRWLLLGVAGAVMWLRILPLDQIKTCEPEGIIALEFAWSAPRAAAILDAWRGIESAARIQTWWDMLFLLCYPTALALACAMLADLRADPVATIGAFVAWAVLAAIPLDAIENLAMLRMLAQGASQSLARLASLCAGIKFTLLLAAVGKLILGGGATLFRYLALRT